MSASPPGTDESIDIDWTSQQRRVIDHREGPLQVIACAGSGKTATISRMIAEMVRDGIDRNSIVAFAFNDNAADELKIRIRQEMGIVNPENPIMGEMFVGTIHVFCKELLARYKPDTMDYMVLNKNKLAAFLAQHYWRLGIGRIIDYRLPPFVRIQYFIEDINTIRRESLLPALQASGDPTAERLLESFAAFRDLLVREHLFDFEELVYSAIELLEGDADVRRVVNEQYKFLVVDEYQDIDPAHERLIGLLAGERRNITVVGDDDQAIYKWKGARVSNFLNFESKYGATVERLERNFRSTEVITRIASRFVSTNTSRLPKLMESGNSADVGDVYALSFDSEVDEVEFIVSKIRDLVGTAFVDGRGRERTIRYGDIAALFRKKNDMGPLVARLTEEGIPYTVRGGESIFSRVETNFIRHAFAFMARGIDPGLSINNYDNGRGDPQPIIVDENTLRELIRSSPVLAPNEARILDYLRGRKAWYARPKEDRGSRRIFPQTELQNLLRAMGLNTVDLREEAYAPLMYDIGQVSSLLMDFEAVYRLIFPDKIKDLVEFMEWGYWGAESHLDDPTRINAVNIMTLHSVKGMQFPVVFMPSLTTKFGTYPSRSWSRRVNLECIPQEIFDYSDYEDSDEDKKRLFYVGLTRSEKFLFLSQSRSNIGEKNNRKAHAFFSEVIGMEDPGVLTEPIADPMPREKREIEAVPMNYVYPTSYSDLRYYMACPYGYMLRTIYGIRPTISSAFDYGSAVHNILRDIHSRFEGSTTMLPSAGEIRTMVADPDKFHLRYASGKVDELLRTEATTILTEYVRDFASNIPLTFRSEVPFEYPLTDATTGGVSLLSGKIDLLEKTDPETGNITEVNIVDFKTGRKPGNEYDPLLRDAAFQVRLYACATRTNMDLTGVEGYVHYLGRPKDKDAEIRGDDKRVPVKLSQSDLAQVQGVVNQSVRRIMKREFFPTSQKEICGKCDYKKLCRYRYVTEGSAQP